MSEQQLSHSQEGISQNRISPYESSRGRAWKARRNLQKPEKKFEPPPKHCMFVIEDQTDGSIVPCIGFKGPEISAAKKKLERMIRKGQGIPRAVSREHLSQLRVIPNPTYEPKKPKQSG